MQVTCEYCSKTIVTMLATRSVEAEGEFWDTHVKKMYRVRWIRHSTKVSIVLQLKLS
jgi:hypothetical protein